MHTRIYFTWTSQTCDRANNSFFANPKASADKEMADTKSGPAFMRGISNMQPKFGGISHSALTSAQPAAERLSRRAPKALPRERREASLTGLRAEGNSSADGYGFGNLLKDSWLSVPVVPAVNFLLRNISSPPALSISPHSLFHKPLFSQRGLALVCGRVVQRRCWDGCQYDLLLRAS